MGLKDRVNILRHAAHVMAKHVHILLALIRLHSPGIGSNQYHRPMDKQMQLELTLVNEVEIIYRNRLREERPLVSTSAATYDILLPFFEQAMETYEVFYVVMLDRGNRVKCVFKASQGGLHGTVADPKVIFAASLKCLASSIIVAHNHPSGQLRPSEEDIRLTRKLVDGARLLDLAVLDHVIMTRNGYYSFADNGML
jgi:DNA repair protein RadC